MARAKKPESLAAVPSRTLAGEAIATLVQLCRLGATRTEVKAKYPSKIQVPNPTLERTSTGMARYALMSVFRFAGHAGGVRSAPR